MTIYTSLVHPKICPGQRQNFTHIRRISVADLPGGISSIKETMKWLGFYSDVCAQEKIRKISYCFFCFFQLFFSLFFFFFFSLFFLFVLFFVFFFPLSSFFFFSSHPIPPLCFASLLPVKELHTTLTTPSHRYLFYPYHYTLHLPPLIWAFLFHTFPILLPPPPPFEQGTCIALSSFLFRLIAL